MNIEETGCCGLNELRDIYDTFDGESTVAKACLSAVTEVYHDGFVFKKAMYLFTDAVVYKHGRRLARFIRANKLGKLTKSPPVMNKNSGNVIEAWFWQPDWEKVKEVVTK